MWKNSLYNTIGGLIKLALGLLSVPLLTRNLGSEAYGLYATINAIVNIAMFSEWSISTAVTIFMAKEMVSLSEEVIKPKEFRTLSVSALFVACIALSTATLIFLSTSFIVSLFENLSLNQKYVLEKAISIGTGVILARFIHQFFIGVLQAHKVYGLINILSTFYTIVSISSTLYIAATTQDLIQIQVIQLIISLLMVVIYWLCCQRAGYLYAQFFTKPSIRELIKLSQYGFRMWISALGSTLFSQFDRLIILRLFGVELAGMYAAITSLANQINVVSSMPIQPILPVLSEYRETSSPSSKIKLESILSKAFTINACLIMLAAVALIFFSEQIVALLFAKYTIRTSIVQMCLIITTGAYAIYSFNATGYFSLLAIRDERFVTRMVVFSGITALSLIYILSLKFGILGACLGNIGYSLTLLLNKRALRRLEVNVYKTLSGTGIIVGLSTFFFALHKLFNSLPISFILYVLFVAVVFAFMEYRFNVVHLIRSRNKSQKQPL